MENQPMTNKERQCLYNKKYREANRELLLPVKAEYRKIMCQRSCGQMVSRNNLSHHLKTKKHLWLLQDQEVIKEEDVVYVDTIDEIDVKVKEEAVQGEPVEEPLLEISDEAISLLQRLLTFSEDDILCSIL